MRTTSVRPKGGGVEISVPPIASATQRSIQTSVKRWFRFSGRLSSRGLRSAWNRFPADLELHTHQQRKHHPPHGTQPRTGGICLPDDLQPGRTSATLSAMNARDIIGEIHRVREKQAQECDFDPKRIGERIRFSSSALTPAIRATSAVAVDKCSGVNGSPAVSR